VLPIGIQERSFSYEDGVQPVAPDNGKSRIDLVAGAAADTIMRALLIWQWLQLCATEQP
jgi:hypothetical protein